MPLLLAFLVVPLIEIALFIQVGGAIGLGWTLLIVVATAIAGATLVRRQGAGVLQKLQRSFNDFQDPSQPLAEGAMILFSGALLLTPGFFTDAVGFALLVPGVRAFLFSKLRDRVTVVKAQGFDQRRPARDDIVEGEYEVQDIPDDDVPPRQTKGPSGWQQH